MMYRGVLFALAAMAAQLSSSTGVQAAVGTQGFADIGTPLAGGSSTGNINTATSFTIGSLESNTSSTGIFTGLPDQNFGAVPFSLSTPTSLSFGDAAFGTFTSTSITEATNIPGSVAIYVQGNWSPGTFGGVTPGSYPSSFTISFTQTPAGSGSISDSGTFSVVPEPASSVAALTSFLVFGVACRRRRSSRVARA